MDIPGGPWMKNRLWFAVLIVFLGLLFCPSSARAEIYAETLATGRIDWSNGMVEAMGVGVPSRKITSRAQARALAVEQARADAARNMFKTIGMLRIDNDHAAKDMMLRHGSLYGHLKTLVLHAAEIQTFFLPPNRVRIIFTVKIRGGVANILLPDSIREIEHIKGGILDKKRYSTDSRKKKAFTGLIIDCRGLKVTPALVPHILDEDGNEVYGPSVVTRKDAVRKGVAGYERKMHDALHDSRVGANPLVVKALRGSGKNSCDIVVSDADAARIIASPKNLGFLRCADVIIVLD